MGFFKNLLKPGSATESNISRALRTVVVSDTPAARNDLHNALKRQRVVLPVPRPLDNLQRDASGRLQQNTRLEFLSFQDSSGRKFIAVFTNPEALKKWKSDAPSWVAIDAQSVCRAALDSGQSVLQINPGDPTFVELSQEEMKLLAEAEAKG
jgi:hypothetical protein